MSTLADLRSRVRDKADINNQTDRYPDSELLGYINNSYFELFGLLMRKLLIRPEAVQTIVSDGSATYDLAADHYATLAVFYSTDNGQFFDQLRRHNFSDRPFGVGNFTGTACSYRTAEVSGDKEIEFYPVPNGETYYISYIPQPTALADDTDEISYVLGWDEYIVVDAAIKALRRDNSNTRALESDKITLLQRIEDEAEQVEMSETLKIRNSRDIDFYRDAADWRWARSTNFHDY